MEERIINVTPTGGTKRGRYLLLVLALPACYYLGIYLTEIFTISEVAILENNIASTESKITANSGRITKLEQEIKEAQQAVTDATSVNDGLVLSNTQRRALLKSLGGVSTPRDDKQTVLPESWWLQAPTTGLFTCTVDWETMLEDKVDELSWYEFIETCWSFEGISWCRLRAEDWANCFKK